MERFQGFEHITSLERAARHYDRLVPASDYDINEALAYIQRDIPAEIVEPARAVLHAAHTYGERSSCDWKQVSAGLRGSYTYGSGTRVDVTTVGSNGAHRLFSDSSRFGAENAHNLIYEELLDAGIAAHRDDIAQLVDRHVIEENEYAFSCQDQHKALQNSLYDTGEPFYCLLSNQRATGTKRMRTNCPSECAEEVARKFMPIGMMVAELLNLSAITVVGGHRFRGDGVVVKYFPHQPEDIVRTSNPESIHFNITGTTVAGFSQRYRALTADVRRELSDTILVTDVLPCYSCADTVANGTYHIEGVEQDAPRIVVQEVSRYHNAVDDNDIASIARIQSRDIPLYHMGSGRIPQFGR